MSKYKTDDGAILNTENAVQRWSEATRWDGSNFISLATGSQWTHESLFLSRRARYWLERASQWQGSTPSAEIISPAQAGAW